MSEWKYFKSPVVFVRDDGSMTLEWHNSGGILTINFDDEVEEGMSNWYASHTYDTGQDCFDIRTQADVLKAMEKMGFKSE